jgi:putative peptidoglycan lipid II flippase
MFPYLLFISLTAFFMGILYTHKAFFIPAFGPCLLNLSFIVMVLFFFNFFKQPVFCLAVAVMLGGMLQLAINIPALSKRGIGREYFSIRNLNFRHPGLKRIGRMFLPRALSAGIYQLNIFVDTICASISAVVGEGAVAAIYYANRIFQFPFSIFGIALSSVTLQDMSAKAAGNDIEGLRSSLAFSIKCILFVMLPVSLGIVILAQPITKILFERGEFTSYSTQITSWALLFYSFGLSAYAVAGILRNAFYALHDTLTPLKISSICVLINVVLNIILMFPLKVGGLALASSISAVVNLSLLYSIMKRRIGGLEDFGMKGYIIKIILSSLIMGLFIILLWYSKLFRTAPIIKLSATIILSALIFGLACIALKVQELNLMMRWILRR